MIKTDLFDEIISSVAVFKVKSEQRDTGVVCPLSVLWSCSCFYAKIQMSVGENKQAFGFQSSVCVLLCKQEFCQWQLRCFVCVWYARAVKCPRI